MTGSYPITKTARSPVVMDVLDAFIFDRTTSLTELTLAHPDAATVIFNLDDYRVLETEILGFGGPLHLSVVRAA